MAGRSSAIPGRSAGLAPVVADDARLLILGSLPGTASLAAAQYYAHPRNGFWPLLGRAMGRDLASMSYPARLQAIKDGGVALWDVIDSAERQGSLDAAIRAPRTTGLNALVAGLPGLRAIAFNGALASRLGRRLLGDRPDLQLIDLPSSSPAHARPLEEKAAVWDRLGQVLG